MCATCAETAATPNFKSNKKKHTNKTIWTAATETITTTFLFLLKTMRLFVLNKRKNGDEQIIEAFKLSENKNNEWSLDVKKRIKKNKLAIIFN